MGWCPARHLRCAVSGALGWLVDGPGIPMPAAKGSGGAVQPGVAGDAVDAEQDGEDGHLAVGAKEHLFYLVVQLNAALRVRFLASCDDKLIDLIAGTFLAGSDLAPEHVTDPVVFVGIVRGPSIVHM